MVGGDEISFLAEAGIQNAKPSSTCVRQEAEVGGKEI
jgi:hypothetical protein